MLEDLRVAFATASAEGDNNISQPSNSQNVRVFMPVCSHITVKHSGGQHVRQTQHECLWHQRSGRPQNAVVAAVGAAIDEITLPIMADAQLCALAVVKAVKVGARRQRCKPQPCWTACRRGHREHRGWRLGRPLKCRHQQLIKFGRARKIAPAGEQLLVRLVKCRGGHNGARPALKTRSLKAPPVTVLAHDRRGGTANDGNAILVNCFDFKVNKFFATFVAYRLYGRFAS